MRATTMMKTGNANGCGGTRNAQATEMRMQHSTGSNAQAAARFHAQVEELARKYRGRDDQELEEHLDNPCALAVPVLVPCTPAFREMGSNPLAPAVSHPGAQGSDIVAAEMLHPADVAATSDLLPAPVGAQRQFTLFPNGVGNLSALAIRFQLDAGVVKASFQDVPPSQFRAIHERKPGLKAALRAQFRRKAEIEMQLAPEESDGAP